MNEGSCSFLTASPIPRRFFDILRVGRPGAGIVGVIRGKDACVNHSLTRVLNDRPCVILKSDLSHLAGRANRENRLALFLNVIVEVCGSRKTAVKPMPCGFFAEIGIALGEVNQSLLTIQG